MTKILVFCIYILLNCMTENM